jgi:CVNH domain
MRRHILAILGATVLVLALAPAGQAQDAPYGSYQQTCRDIRSDGDRLSAHCQRADGGWNDTSLDYRNCRGEVINDNGNLRCGGDNRGYNGGHDDRSYDNRGYDNRSNDNRGYYSDGRWEGGLPPGDYKRTCRNMSVNGDRLNATCERVDGGWRNTTLKHFDRCQSMIVNDNGNLRCQR